MENPFERFTPADLVGRQTLKWQAYPPDVLPLWVAEMDTELAEPVRDAVVVAVRRGEVGYPWGRAYPEALSLFARDVWGWSLDPDTVRHTADVMTGMANVVRLVAPSDGVLVLTTPVYPPFLELERLAGLAAEHGVRVVVDEIHAPLVHPGAIFTPFLSIDGAERAYAVHSASKAFNLPGLKAALIVPGPAVVDEITAGLPATLDHSASSVGVLAHAVALTEGRDWLAAHLHGLARNRTQLGSLLTSELPEIGWQPPEATYLAWLDCRRLGLGEDPAEVLLTRGKVAVNNGRDFGPGGAGHVRLNFATAPQVLTEAVGRIRDVVAA